MFEMLYGSRATPEIETFHNKIILISHWQLRALVFFEINNKYLNYICVDRGKIIIEKYQNVFKK